MDKLTAKCSLCKRELPVEKMVAWDFSIDYIECFDCSQKYDKESACKTNKEKFPRKLTEQEKDRLAMELSEESQRDGETEDKEKKE